MSVKKGKLSDLKTDQKNMNKHSPVGMKLLENSLQQLGAGRSILISADNEIIAGNGVAETAMQAGIDKTIVVETTGNELVVVKRTDIKSNSKEFFKMALADNVVAQKNIVIDAEAVEAVAEAYDLGEWAGEVERPVINKEQPKVDVNEMYSVQRLNFSFTSEMYAKVVDKLGKVGMPTKEEALIKLLGL